MHISVEAKGGDHSEEGRFTCPGLLPESGDLLSEVVRIFFVDGKGIDRKFCLAEINDAIPAIDYQVDLRAFFMDFTGP